MLYFAKSEDSCIEGSIRSVQCSSRGQQKLKLSGEVLLGLLRLFVDDGSLSSELSRL